MLHPAGQDAAIISQFALFPCGAGLLDRARLTVAVLATIDVAWTGVPPLLVTDSTRPPILQIHGY